MLIARPFTVGDHARLLRLGSHEPERHRHVVDLAYRLCSPSAQVLENSCLWETAGGELVGFAAIQRQFWSIDYCVAPAHPEVFTVILAWADERMQAVANEIRDEYRDGIMNFVDCYADDTERQTELAAAGYVDFAEWTQMHRWQTLDRDLRDISPPEGFILRPVAGMAEAAACAALQRLAFDSTNMTTEWRERIMQAENYVPELDLALARPTGDLVAFCLGWQLGDQGQVEPLAVHPEFQRMGLGRVLLRTCLRRMQQRGVAVAHIEDNGEEGPPASLYASEGFAHPRRVRKYMRRWHASDGGDSRAG